MVPATYQLVPLLMALYQSEVRFLMADSVGLGKAVAARLIVRELLFPRPTGSRS